MKRKRLLVVDEPLYDDICNAVDAWNEIAYIMGNPRRINTDRFIPYSQLKEASL